MGTSAGHQAPFTVYFKMAIPAQTRLQSRQEKLRYASKISIALYSNLANNSNLNIAQPSGSTDSSCYLYNLADIANSMQFKPQFGESPAQLVTTGFYILATNPVPTYANSVAVLDNQFLYGPQSGPVPLATINPQASVAAEVKALKAIFDAAVATVVLSYSDCALKTFRINYKSVTWGDRGLHFPQ